MTINDPRDSPEYQTGGDKYKAQYEALSSDVPAKIVNDFHKKADTDSSAQAIHHTLGAKHDQASPGDHTHNGESSLQIFKGIVLTGSKGGNVALASVCAALAQLGATNNTT